MRRNEYLAAMVRRTALALCAGVAIAGCDNAEPNRTPAPTQPARQWTMPNLVGMTVQQAQDAIQALTGGAILISTSHDATGRGRGQVLDSNWKVCSQNVSSGSSIGPDTRIDFGAVKFSEACP